MPDYDCRPGRSCRLSYSYPPEALAHAPGAQAETLYVVGGLYGNVPALDEILEMAEREVARPTLAFNGDFNWFNIDAENFEGVNSTVLRHDASLGNVEAELLAENSLAGCGCAYPDDVDDCIVERSNAIHKRLRERARHYPGLTAQIAALPKFRRYLVGACRVAVVHGDNESLAGWNFDESALRAADESKLARSAVLAGANLFASTHTCLPVLKRFTASGKEYAFINNGSAGMPNFNSGLYGVITRIGVTPPQQPALYGTTCQDVFIHALAVHYDQERWTRAFLANWPEGSPAFASYFGRISRGTSYQMRNALLL